MTFVFICTLEISYSYLFIRENEYACREFKLNTVMGGVSKIQHFKYYPRSQSLSVGNEEDCLKKMERVQFLAHVCNTSTLEPEVGVL